MIVGIDLGTTNSLVSVFRDGAPVLIPNVHGSVLTPSVIGLDDTGAIVVGAPAKHRLLTHPTQTVACVKRFMGTSRSLSLGKQAFRPEELSALILRSLKADAEKFLGGPVEEAVITVPAYFNDVQRRATRDAGELAGLRVERLISEPTAAALAYGLHEQDEREFLVFDLGGGTFDVSVLELFEGVLEVRASTGDNHLGGEDFTAVLIESLLAAYGELSPQQMRNLSRTDVAQLYAVAERAKCDLSSATETKVSLSLERGEREVELTRDAFEARSHELLERVRDPVRRALRDSKIQASDLDAIVLVGGATRMPMIQKLVTTLFARFPERRIDPDAVVAMGAAVQAALKQRDAALKEVVLTDVCPYTLGIETSLRVGEKQFRAGTFSPIIERNTTVPVSREHRYYTVHDNQKQIDVRVYQGESIDVSENVLLGELTIAVERAKAGAVAVDVRFSYDVNGLLEVDVLAVGREERKTLLIEGTQSSLTPEQIAASLERLRVLKIHPRDDEVNLELIYRAKRMYALLTSGDRDAIVHNLAWFESILERQDEREIRAARAKLEEFLDGFGFGF